MRLFPINVKFWNTTSLVNRLWSSPFNSSHNYRPASIHEQTSILCRNWNSNGIWQLLFPKPVSSITEVKAMKVIPSPQLIRDSLSGSLSRSLFNTPILNSEYGEHLTLNPLNSYNKIINLYSTYTRVNYNQFF